MAFLGLVPTYYIFFSFFPKNPCCTDLYTKISPPFHDGTTPPALRGAANFPCSPRGLNVSERRAAPLLKKSTEISSFSGTLSSDFIKMEISRPCCAGLPPLQRSCHPPRAAARGEEASASCPPSPGGGAAAGASAWRAASPSLSPLYSSGCLEAPTKSPIKLIVANIPYVNYIQWFISCQEKKVPSPLPPGRVCYLIIIRIPSRRTVRRGEGWVSAKRV